MRAEAEMAEERGRFFFDFGGSASLLDFGAGTPCTGKERGCRAGAALGQCSEMCVAVGF